MPFKVPVSFERPVPVAFEQLPTSRTFQPMQTRSVYDVTSADFVIPMSHVWEIVSIDVYSPASAGSYITLEVFNPQNYSANTPVYEDSSGITNLEHHLKVAPRLTYSTRDIGVAMTRTELAFPFQYLDGGWAFRLSKVLGGSIYIELVYREVNLVA